MLGRVQEGDSSVETKDLFLLYALLASWYVLGSWGEKILINLVLQGRMIENVQKSIHQKLLNI